MITDDFLETLVGDDDRWHEEPDNPGVEWKYRVEYDPFDPMGHINDADCWGTLVWTRDNRDTGWSVRPDTFGPHSRKLTSDYGQSLWWEPYDWREGMPDRDFEEEFREVKRLIEDGFCMASLHRRQLCAACGEKGRELSTYVGGIDVWPFDDEGAHVGFCGDMVAEIEYQLKENA